jgi:hypothetical protein
VKTAIYQQLANVRATAESGNASPLDKQRLPPSGGGATFGRAAEFQQTSNLGQKPDWAPFRELVLEVVSL